MRTVTCGLPGSSMPGFPLVPEPQRKDVVQYVLHLAKFGLAQNDAAQLCAEEGLTPEQVRKDHLPAIRAAIEGKAAGLRRITVPPEPDADAAGVERGRGLFDKQCAACHGARGVGDGASSSALRDWQNAPIRPRDFTSGVFRAGSTPDDVYVRIRTGLNGTPMPGYSNLADGQTWDLVHFILSLRDPNAPRPQMAPGCGPEEDGR
jgi:mono/diheme cytochrome c family protein